MSISSLLKLLGVFCDFEIQSSGCVGLMCVMRDVRGAEEGCLGVGFCLRTDRIVMDVSWIDVDSTPRTCKGGETGIDLTTN